MLTFVATPSLRGALARLFELLRPNLNIAEQRVIAATPLASSRLTRDLRLGAAGKYNTGKMIRARGKKHVPASSRSARSLSSTPSAARWPAEFAYSASPSWPISLPCPYLPARACSASRPANPPDCSARPLRICPWGAGKFNVVLRGSLGPSSTAPRLAEFPSTVKVVPGQTRDR